MKKIQADAFGYGLHADYSNRKITFEIEEVDEVPVDKAALLTGIHLDEGMLEGPIMGAATAISSVFRGLGDDDDRMLQCKVSVYDFLSVMEPLVSGLIGGPVDSIKRLIILAYAAHAIVFTDEEDQQDLFEVRVISGFFSDVDEFAPEHTHMLYLSVPYSFALLVHLVRDEGFKVSLVKPEGKGRKQ